MALALDRNLILACVGWFPNLTRAYDNNGRCPRQKFDFGILQLRIRSSGMENMKVSSKTGFNVMWWMAVFFFSTFRVSYIGHTFT